MKAETLLESMNYLGEDLLLQSEQPITARTRRPMGWIAAAACLVLGLGAALWALHLARADRPVQPATEPPAIPTETMAPVTEEVSLPLLSVADNYCCGAGLAEGQEAGDLIRPNCWAVDQTYGPLPVYENLAYGSRLPTCLDRQQMEAIAVRTATALHETFVPDPEPVTGDDAAHPETLTGSLPSGEITVFGDGSVQLVFTDLAMMAQDVRLRDPLQAAEHFYGSFQALLGQEVPAFALETRFTGPDTEMQTVLAWEQSEDFRQTWLNNQLWAVRLQLTQDGQLASLVLPPAPETRRLLGNYPILTPDQALARLEAGDYYTEAEGQVPPQGPAAMELVYETRAQHPCLMPFYRFWVLRYDSSSQVYTAYYVPAVDPAYLTYDYPDGTEAGANP